MTGHSMSHTKRRRRCRELGKTRGIWGTCDSLAVFGSCHRLHTLEFKSFRIKATERLWAEFDGRAFNHSSSFWNLVVKILKYDHSNASYWAVSPAILHAYYAVQMDSNFEFCTRDPHLNYQRLRNLATQYVSSVKSVLKTKRISIWKFYTRFGV